MRSMVDNMMREVSMEFVQKLGLIDNRPKSGTREEWPRQSNDDLISWLRMVK